MGMATAIASAPNGALEARLSSFARLRPEDLQALHRGLTDVRVHPIRSDVLANDPTAVRLAAGGWIGLIRLLSNGRRQILQIALPGDLIPTPRTLGDQVVALTAARSVDARALLRPDTSSGLRKAVLAAQEEAHRRLLDQIVRLGSLTAYERTADFIAELAERHERAGIGDGSRIPWPITQEVLSDILGLSVVHVNRVLQQLRRDGLIEIRAGVLVVCAPDRLARAGGVRVGTRPNGRFGLA